MFRPARPLALAFVVAAVSSGPIAAAQSESEVALARKYFSDGEAAEKKNDCKGAVAHFKKALAIKETAQIWLRVGACQEKLQDPVAAAVAYERALEKAKLANLDQVAGVAQEQLDAVRSKLGSVVLRTKDTVADLKVKLDGEDISAATLGGELPLRPGDHRVEATAPGRKPFAETFRVAAKESKILVLDLEVDPTAAGVGGAGPGPNGGAGGDGAGGDTTGGGGTNVPAIALLAGGGAAVAAGTVFLVLSSVKDGDIDDQCGGPERKACPQSKKDEINSDISTVDTFRIVGIVVSGAGVGAAVVGVAMLLTGGSGAPAKASRPAIVPSLTPRSAGVWVTGSF